MQKTIITKKVLVTQSFSIVHSDQHTEKPTCADLQAFSNTFSLFKLIFFHFLSGGVKECVNVSVTQSITQCHDDLM